jgi:hypothetical protein
MHWMQAQADESEEGAARASNKVVKGPAKLGNLDPRKSAKRR